MPRSTECMKQKAGSDLVKAGKALFKRQDA